MSEEFYQFNINQLNGEEISLSKFKGKVILIVNTASYCGLTYHYTGLEKLYQEYKDNGLVIIGFPCNQFGKQEPGRRHCCCSWQQCRPLQQLGSKLEPRFLLAFDGSRRNRRFRRAEEHDR